MAFSHGKHPRLTRRDFLRTMGLSAAGLVVASCAPQVATGIAPTVQPTGLSPTVAIAKAATYDRSLIQKQVQAVLDGIGGLQDVLAHGNRVAIKVNITGSAHMTKLKGLPEVETYITHPEVVRALGQLLRDAGATKLYIVEALYAKSHWHDYGWDQVAQDIGATLIDLNDPAPYNDFIQTPVPKFHYIYNQFTYHPILTDVDAFVSVPKMKCHNTLGVTQSMKNLIGTAPYHFYELKETDNYRSGFHGQPSETPVRLPKIVMDLNRARPVNLALIDGVMTVEGGEGPWVRGLNQVKAGVLLAGKDPVATDATATSVMNFDPTADYPNPPFVHAYNHLNLARNLGLGTNNMSEIKVVGTPVKDVQIQFKVSY